MSTSTWNTQPDSSEWNSADNWTPAGVPTDTASFGKSCRTKITFSPTGDATVKEIEFTDETSYTFSFGSSDTPGPARGVTRRACEPR